MATITSPRSESPAVGLSRITSPTLPSASASDTPTSSVRPSFEIPRSSTSSPAPQQNANAGPTAHRRNRAALRDYYNLKGRVPSAAGSHTQGQDHNNISRTVSIASNASDSTVTTTDPSSSYSSLTARLDDPDFDAEAYVSELLKTAGLRDILKTEGTLVSEIRNLDGERKALVYDNYSKLIKAVGTIAEMQKGMHKREQGDKDKLSALGVGLAIQTGQAPTPGLDGVEKLAAKLDGLLEMVKELAPATDVDRTKQVMQARRTIKQRQTVKWALDAPLRLQTMLDHGRKDEAVNEYKSVVELLDQWKGVGGVDDLRVKCDKVMHATASSSGEEQAQRDGVDKSG
ncbi:hypothetical protein A1O1_03073 [Capronia coronata CBS 617.96]|uniref:Vacuolar protein sorting-associated protein 51 homolog n=1 Tax=Capronia coronata CBS 617.96 TaxID=1182541 RepID=W9YZE8_9EURO|nr:uncharacterized protein A1O1_03073 [Capronia coronata CBS 617.96]EXJ94676.1 hypothetical protein A1O1_03073 [Capronia coronata CBS 617.96]